jgi:NADPH:quinone reductase-like Zn-dependent oxidoreductase
MRFVERGLIKPVVDRTMQLSELAQAQNLMETNAVAGKIVILPA